MKQERLYSMLYNAIILLADDWKGDCWALDSEEFAGEMCSEIGMCMYEYERLMGVSVKEV